MPVKSLVAFIVLIFYFPYLVDCFINEASESAKLLDLLQNVVS
jgi:type III secretory pathway component EscT